MSIESLTEGFVEGNGVFDKLMQSVKAHLDVEFKQNRLSGEEYAKTYTALTTTILQQSIQYLLTEPQTAAQVALINSQRTKTDAETDLVAVQRANAVKEGVNLDKQALRFDKDLELADLQKVKLTADTNLVDQQTANALAQADNIPLEGEVLQANKLSIEAETARIGKDSLLLDQRLANLITEDVNATKQGLILDRELTRMASDIARIDADTTQTGKQSALIDQQTLNTTAEGLNIPKQGVILDKQASSIDEEILASTAQRTQLAAQTTLTNKQVEQANQDITESNNRIAKIQKETDVLDQRKKTEEAQIRDTVDGITVTGVVGKQKNLYQAQTDGFQRDAEQKLMKNMTDIWAVQRTTDNGISPAGAGLADAEIAKVVTKALQGINVT